MLTSRGTHQRWVAKPVGNNKKGKGKSAKTGRMIRSAHIDDLKLAPIAPAVLSGDIHLGLYKPDENDAELNRFAPEIITAPRNRKLNFVVREESVSARVFGITTSGILLE